LLLSLYTVIPLVKALNANPPADSSRIIPKAIKYIIEEIISIENIKNTSIFSLTVRAHEPKLASELSKVIIDKLGEQELEFKKYELKDQNEFISGRLVEISHELYKAETKLKNFREDNLQISLSPTLMLEQERLERELEVQTQLFISLKQQLEQVKIEEARNSTNLKIIDPPNIPIQPSKPRKILIVLFAILSGLVVGGGYSIKKYYKN